MHSALRGVRVAHARLMEIEREMVREEDAGTRYNRMVANGTVPGRAVVESGLGGGSAFDARGVQALLTAGATAHAVARRAVGEINTTRVEVGGPAPERASVADELTRDDPTWLLKIMQVAARAT